MDDLSQRTLKALQDLNFEVQPTTFSDITSKGEMARLREYKTIPEGDSGKILRHFPNFFVIHRSAIPELGIFFVTLAESTMNLNKEAQEIYQQYFPSDLLIVAQDHQRRLVAWWQDSNDKPQPLDTVISNRLEK